LVDLHFDWLFGDGPSMLRSRADDSPACDPLAILELNQPNIVVNRRTGEKTRVHMATAKPDWVLLYQDKIAQVWGRRSVYDDPAVPSYIPADQRSITDNEVSGYVSWPAFPTSPNESTSTRKQSSGSRSVASRN